MPLDRLARFIALPELEITKITESHRGGVYETRKTSSFEVCPKCASKCSTIYDRRWAQIADEPIRGKTATLRIHKRRFWCKSCEKPFTEPISGIGKGNRTTERYRKALLWACENFESLTKARRYMNCSSNTLYRLYYNQLRLELKKRQYPWPKTIGIDEHKYGKNREKNYPEFATVFVDHKGKRIYEVAKGRDVYDVTNQIRHIPGRENVQLATIDLSNPYRRLIKENFPNAKIVADKFHVVRLMHPVINRMRKEITGDKRKLGIRKLLLRNGKELDFFTKSAIYKWLEDHPELREVYMAKEAIHGIYRIKGYKRAKKAYGKLLDRLGESTLKEIKTLRRTLISWKDEILQYFITPATNGRTEAFNGKAKLVRKRGYGFRSFKNYRLRLLVSCT